MEPTAPDPAALAHSQRLVAHIRAEMAQAGGALPFDRYMELTLYAPGLGYYMAGSHKLGAGGDFVTAPELSPLFGACLARQCAQVLTLLGGGDILELGAGSGALAVSLLEELGRRGPLPGRYLILEPSPDLQERQRQALAGLDAALAGRVQWVTRLPSSVRGLVLANEVVDALPVHRFRMEQGQPREIRVRWGEGGFEEFAGPPSPALAAAVAALQATGVELEDGYGSELNLRAGPWVASLGERLAAGVLLLIDYGYPRLEYYRPERDMGTLLCHHRHRAHGDPYRLVGLQDITAHVDFTALTEAGRAAGLDLAGYTSQALFLLGCGLEECLAEALARDPGAHLDWVQEAKQLLLPEAMGERFQVLALSRGLVEPLLGFRLRDLRERL